MNGFIIPLAGMGLGALTIVVAAIVKINQAKYQAQAGDEIADELRNQIEQVKTRVEALESIVISLDKRME